jgi:hypothetical protein
MKKWFVLFVLLGVVNLAEAGTFDIIPSKGSLAFVGEIAVGDADKLAGILTEQKFNRFVQIYLDSPGGSVNEAARMAQVIKTLYLTTRVAPEKICASACFLMYLAGSGREASPFEMKNAKSRTQWNSIKARVGSGSGGMPGFVGLHRPFLRNIDSLENNQVEVMRRMAGYLEGQMLSRRLIDLMMSRPSNDVYWLKADDLKEIGEYAPEQEELFINKCGYDRNYLDKIFSHPNEAQITQKILAKQNASVECVGNLIFMGSQRGWEKLKAGWLPAKQVL